MADNRFIVLGDTDYRKLQDKMNQYTDYDVRQVELASNSQYALVALQKKEEGGGGTTDYNGLTNKPKINGFTLIDNVTPSQLKLETNFEQKRIDFVANYGSVTLLGSEYSAWSTWISAHTLDGIYFVPYDNALMVQAFVTSDTDYQLQFVRNGKLYGKNADGIKELTVNTASVPTGVKDFLETGKMDAGTF